MLIRQTQTSLSESLCIHVFMCVCVHIFQKKSNLCSEYIIIFANLKNQLKRTKTETPIDYS